MAKTITKIDSYVSIEPYEYKGQKFDTLLVSARYSKGKGFVVDYQPGWNSGFGWGCFLDFSKDPLTAGGKVLVEVASKNNVKKLQAMHANLDTDIAKQIIAFCFNRRNFIALEMCLKYIALDGTWASEKQFETLKAASKKNETNENESSANNNSNTTQTMANSAKKNADYIGRELVVGNNIAKYTIVNIENDKVTCKFERNGAEPIVIPNMTLSGIKAMLSSGKVHWAGEETTANEDAKDESDVDEITSEDVEKATAEPVEQVEPIEDDTEDESKGEPKEEPKTEQPKAKRTTKKTATAKVTFGTYTTKRGKTGGKIMGFDENDEIYLAGPELHASKTWVRKNGKRIYTLLFGPRYKDAAEAMAQAINEGAGVDECQAIIDNRTEERKQEREEWKAEYAKRKAEREAAKANETTEKPKAKNAKASAKTTAKAEKVYTEAQVKERIRNAFKILADTLKVDVNKFEPIIKAA